ncbi:SWIM zinc finger family protein [Nitriliruptor alkaliphilus]|uniref:SWIM zinc finger family protein n=1 Tax=Nitriliruptor alkaliphilus TaxID=427918 RepID=UPI00069775FC|nr:SWIM zinc finger family protein [Nitriliruptor alkaliphilus]
MPRRRDPWADRFPPSSPPIPVEGGIRARSRRGAIGASWWSRRFLEVLESLGIGGRLDRGRTYARKGQVISLEVQPGAVTARVQGSRARPYDARIALDRLSEADWELAEEAMAERASFLAKLLAGEMPIDIEDAFEACSTGLFPSGAAELTTTCSCPDWANPCKHLAAMYYLLAEAFDEDPFLMLRWRGRDRDELLGHLRALRGTEQLARAEPYEDDPWTPIEQAVVLSIEERTEGFWSAGPELSDLRLTSVPPTVPDATVRSLAPLERTLDGRPLGDVLAAAYATMTKRAHTRLTGDSGSQAPS